VPLLINEVKQRKPSTFIEDDDAAGNSQRIHLNFEVFRA
jgi:hypothetical protein